MTNQAFDRRAFFGLAGTTAVGALVAASMGTGTFGSIDWNVDGARGRGGRGQALGLLQIQTDDLSSHVPEVWNRRKDAYIGSGASRYGKIGRAHV